MIGNIWSVQVQKYLEYGICGDVRKPLTWDKIYEGIQKCLEHLVSPYVD